MNDLYQKMMNVIAAADMIGSDDSQFGDAMAECHDLIDAHADDRDRLIRQLMAVAPRYDHDGAIDLVMDLLAAIEEYEHELRGNHGKA